MRTKTVHVDWGGHYVKLTWIPGTLPPDRESITSVHGVCIHQDKVLLVRIAGRGFNLPGGHMEQGETPEETLLRECMEEGYVRCNTSVLIGIIEVSHEDNPLFDPDGKYPLIGYQLFYRTQVAQCLPYKREHEGLTRIWVEPEEIPYVMEDHELAPLIVAEAVRPAPGRP